MHASAYPVNVAKGLVPGASIIAAYGKRTASGAETNKIIWPNGAFSIPSSSGVQMSIVSTSVNDAAAGTHARKVEIHYLDANLSEQSEIVTLNGTTPVLTTATDIRFINVLHLHEVGANSFADGDITATESAVNYGQISSGEVINLSTAKMVPAGKKCFVAGASAGAVSGAAAAGVFTQIVATEYDSNQYLIPLAFFPYGGIGLQDSSEAYTFPSPIPFSAGTVIAVGMTTDKAATVGASWYGWLENAD